MSMAPEHAAGGGPGMQPDGTRNTVVTYPWESTPIPLPDAPAPTPVPRYLYLLSLFLIGLAFIRLLPNSNPLSTGLTMGRLYEAGLLIVGLGVVPAVLLLRGYVLRPRLSEQLPLLAFCGWATLSMVWSDSPMLSLSKAVQLGFIVFGAALFAAAFAEIRRSPYDFANMLALALTGLVFVGLIANTFIWGSPFAMRGLDGSRPRLLFGYSHPIEFADLASFALIAWLVSRFPWQWKLIAASFLLYIHHQTDARMSMAAILLTLLAMFLIRSGPRMRLFVAFVAGYAVLAYFLVITFGPRPDKPFAPFVALMPSDAQSLNGRRGLWAVAMERFDQSPLTGVGFYASRFTLMPRFEWAGDTHNAWIETLLTTGLVGFALLLVVIALSFAVALRTNDLLLASVLIYVLLTTYTAAPLIAPKLPTVMLLICLNEALSRLPLPQAAPWPDAPSLPWSVPRGVLTAARGHHAQDAASAATSTHGQ